MILVVGSITWLGAWRYVWTEWMTSLDHKKIGIMYILLALVMLMRGFVDAAMMRSQQAIAFDSQGYLPPGVVTLSEISPIWMINQQAKYLKSLASTLAVVGKFRSV